MRTLPLPLTLVTTLSLLAAPGCDPTAGSDDDGAPAETGGDDVDDGEPETSDGPADESTGGTESSGGEVEDEESGGSTDSDTAGGPLVWHDAGGPCGGSITNAMWFDDPMTGFIGCGENGSGEGLYTTLDGGFTWEDNVKFKEVRIMDIRRGDDGVLYGAGRHQLDDYPVWSFDESGGAIDAVGLYTPSNNAFLSVNQAENAAITADGQMLVDSLTGTSAAYRPAGGEFEEISSLSEEGIDDPDALSYQVRRIKDFDNRFYATGSVINDPARVHLPSQMAAATHHFQTVLLQPDTRDGEMTDMHVWDETKMVVVGFDQSERFPLIYRVDGGDPYATDGWEKVELLDFGIEYEGGIKGLSVSGDTVVAVGEKVPTSAGGFIVLSEDAGVTWTEITPTDLGKVSSLSRVKLFEDGSMVVAGGGGELMIYGPE